MTQNRLRRSREIVEASLLLLRGIKRIRKRVRGSVGRDVEEFLWEDNKFAWLVAAAGFVTKSDRV